MCPQGDGSSHPDASDVVAGRYRLEREIGSGGFGTVFEATDLDAGNRVAVKMLRRVGTEDGWAEQRFRREAELVTRLCHRNVVNVFDHGHTRDGVPYIAMELLRGRSLRDELKAHGALGTLRTGRIAVQLLRGLAHAHGLGIVHRDIKPGNVFLCEGAEDDFVRMLDFGIAKAVAGDRAAATQLTATGELLGTPQYMAPEQVRGEPIGPAADLYSLGLLMVEMMTGRRLADADTEIDIMMSHVADAPWQLGPAVEESPLRHVIQRAVTKAAEQRYATAEQMLADLEGALQQAEQPAPVAAGLHAPAAPASRIPAIPLVSTGGIPPVSSAPYAPPAAVPALPTPSPKQSSSLPLVISILVVVLGVVGLAAAGVFALYAMSEPEPKKTRGPVAKAGATSRAKPKPRPRSGTTGRVANHAPDEPAPRAAPRTTPPPGKPAATPRSGSTARAESPKSPARAKKASSSPCETHDECGSGHCVDGVCCNSACTGRCRRCAPPDAYSNSPGVCQSVKKGKDPDNECAGATVCNGKGGCMPP